MSNGKLNINSYNHYPETWDEMYDDNVDIRSHYLKFAEVIKSLSQDDLTKKVDFSSQLFLNQGITFTVYNNSKGTEKIFPYDIIPRIITAKEWHKVESGIKQRIKALNLFIKDTYSNQFIYKDGIVPFEQILSSNDYSLQMYQLKVPNDIYTHIAGVDLIRNNDGEFYVLEDNLRTPSGVSYMIENREISKRIFPAALSSSRVIPITNYAQMLSNKLKGLSDKNNPNIVLLTPGIYNSAYYEHTTLARLMGVELVEGQDLFVDNNIVFMKNAGGIKKVDVIYRRVDDDFLDPLVFNSTSKLGVSSIMSAYRSGNVVIVNAPGTGFADDKATYTYVPDMIKYYLNEEPILKNIQTHKLSDKSELEYVLKNIDSMVVKKTDGSGGYGMLIGNAASEKEIDDYKKQILANPKGFIAQPTLNLSTAPCFIDGKLAPRCVDFRPFALMGADGIDVCPGGLSRVALKEGSLVVNSSQGGGSKDTWVLKK